MGDSWIKIQRNNRKKIKERSNSDRHLVNHKSSHRQSPEMHLRHMMIRPGVKSNLPQ